MDVAQRNHIMKQFLKEMSLDHTVEISNEQLAKSYTALAGALDWIELQAGDLFDFSSPDTIAPQWSKLRDILIRGTSLEAGSPPRLLLVKDKILAKRSQFWRNDRELASYPNCDYYRRETRDIESEELQGLIIASRAKLTPIIRSFLKKATVEFDPANNSHLTSIINSKKEELAIAPKNSDKAKELSQQVTLMEDLFKINQLSAIHIPNEFIGHTTYCRLAEAAGGVTKKISLIRLAKVQEQLTRLNASNITSVDAYNAGRLGFSLNTEAILKLPKHGEITEVQREAIALNLSRILGHDTARSTMVRHLGKPALFVPFDNIKLLKEFASGKVMKADFGLFGKTYTHYSTINPVGSGLQADKFVHDFGNSIGLFYLCNDPDAVGAYNQNKALRNSQSLFVFDQVIMADDKLKIDSRISMQPSQIMMKHTRHGRGRNRTLIEDSALVDKFESLMQLKAEQTKLMQSTERVVVTHQQRLEELNIILREELSFSERRLYQSQLNDVKSLQYDAMKLRENIRSRIEKIDELLPAHSDTITLAEIRQTLILEKLMHNPSLFTDDGRPYKNPWTYRHTNPVQSIETIDEAYVAITFKTNINTDMVAFIKRHGDVDSLTQIGSKQLSISRTDLAKLNETMLYPEYQIPLTDTNYLDPLDLKLIGAAYDDANQEGILKTIADYQTVMNTPGSTDYERLKAMLDAQKELNTHFRTATDKGFSSHVLKKFYYDNQQQLQQMIPVEQQPAKLNEAFAAAAKLDRIVEFNVILYGAVVNNQLTSTNFTNFLNGCINATAHAHNHTEAKQQSKNLLKLSETTLKQFLQLGQTEVLSGLPPVRVDTASKLKTVKHLEDKERTGISIRNS